MRAVFVRAIRWLHDRLFARQPYDPAIRIRAVREEFQEKLAGSKDSLARLSVAVGRLQVRIDSNRARAEELSKRQAAYKKVGKHDLVGELGAELSDLDSALAHDSQELRKTQALLETNRRSLDGLQREFEGKIETLERLRSEVQGKELQAELAAMVGIAARKAEESRTALDDLQRDLETRHDLAAGRVRVALDLADGD